jgi:hypothetical protein
MENAGPMVEHSFTVGVIVAKRKLSGPWASHAWLPCAVLPAAPDVTPWTRLTADENEETFYGGPGTVMLAPSETSHYRDNLNSGRPSLWVGLRSVGGEDYEISVVTANPYEGEALVEGMGDVIEAVPMPVEIQEKVAAFFEAFHVERPFFKRKRDRADPEALARRPSGARPAGEDE